MKTVVIRMNGGMGNQLFQYAYAKALADRFGARLKIDRSLFALQHVPERYRLDEFGLEPLFTGTLRNTAHRLLLSPRLPGGLRDALWRMLGVDVVTDTSDTKTKRETALLVGYFQQPAAFLSVQNALRREFRLPIIGEKATIFSKRMQSTNSVAVHIRRGDYARVAEFRENLGVLSADYYRHCMDTIRQRVKDPQFFLFSDDPDWVAKHILSGAPDAVAVDLGDDAKDTTEMALMRECRHFIIANSTFSWWPAFLGASDSKIVLAPSPWFRGKKVTGEELLLTDWERMNAIWEG